MKQRSLLLLLLVAVFSGGCCSFMHRPVEGKARKVFTIDGPPSATNTGSLIVTFGTLAHPTTRWWVDSKTPPSEPGAVHYVNPSLDEIVTGIPAGRRIIVFSAAKPAKAPRPIRMRIEAGKTHILSVDYREPQ